MIGYITVGTNHLEQATAFYDELFSEMGGSRSYQTDHLTAWGFGEGRPAFTVAQPFDQNEATVGNGVMIALPVKNPAAVDHLHARALALGASSEGDPHLKGKNFYVGYFRDLDGNKLNFFCYT
ncbi:VOC family protein [Endozoicomonas lisbonensis]|uniref:Catechol 2,3-dioxygenase-like lactoylglutathione lyase family enzyme n=1 Tax=Endozoicomonas lisbonensis TaxID=3120522 RepID=A0ABV2SAS5_9GAMM